MIAVMIARHWRGWTRIRDAENYQKLLTTKVLPGLKALTGYRGGYVLRRDDADQSEFLVVNFFESLDAVRTFAGPDYTLAVFEPEAKTLLSRAEPNALHYEVRVDTVSK
jgi:heme-degrading monooxygenase HmoA